MWALILTALKFVGGLPLISSVVGFFGRKVIPAVKDKHRLWIEYFLIGLMIVAATLAVSLWLQRERVERNLKDAQTKVTNLQNRVTAVESVNATQEETIKFLNEQRELDRKVLTGLNDDYQVLSVRDETDRRRITELEKNNEEVRNDLDQRGPADLSKLLR